MIKLEHVYKDYPIRDGMRNVLQDINLTLQPGDKLGILGRNGAGKSTLIRLLSGVEHPTSGKITRDMSISWPLAFGGAFQGSLTGADNVRFVCRVYGVNYKQVIDKIEEFAELGDYLYEPVKVYSAGMRARLGFAISLAIEFECYLIDEVISVGDARFQEKCRIELFEKRKDRSLILVSHEIHNIREYCNLTSVLSEGILYNFNNVDEGFEFYNAQVSLLDDNQQSLLTDFEIANNSKSTELDDNIRTIDEFFQLKKYDEIIVKKDSLSEILKDDNHFYQDKIIKLLSVIGHSFLLKGNYHEADEQFKQLIERYPKRHEGYEGLVNVAQHQHNWEQTIERTTELQTRFPQLWQSYWWKGHALKDLHRYHEADEQFKQLIERYPERHEGYEGLVNVAQHQHNWEQTIERTTELQTRFPQLWQSYWWKGHALKDLHRYHEADEQFKQLIERYPERHEGYEGLVNVAQHQHNWEQTIERTTELQTRFPQLWQSYWWKGHALKDLHRYHEADEQFKQLIERYPERHEGYEGLVNVAQHQHNWEQTIERTTELQTRFPQLWQSYWWLGHTFLDIYQYDFAEEQFKQLIDKFPDYQYGYEGLVNIVQRKNDWSEIIQRTTSLQDKFPEMWQTYWWLGVAYKELRQFDKAKMEFESLIKKNFSINLTIKANLELLTLGFSLYDRWITEAEYLKDVIFTNPNDLGLVIKYIEALLAVDNFDDTEYTINYFLTTYNDNLEINQKRCILYHHKKEWVLAKEHFKQFFEQFPNDRSLDYHYLNVLYNLQQLDEFKYFYHQHNIKRFPQKAINKELDGFRCDLLLNNFPKNIDELVYEDELANIGATRHLDIELVINNPENEILFICFDGMYPFADIQYKYDKFNDNKVIEKGMNPSLGKYNFDGFANNTKQFNFLLIKDFSASYYQLDFDECLAEILTYKKQLSPKYIVCMGLSVGGFSSILFGQKIKADVVFAFMPRLQGMFFEDSDGLYHRAIQEKFNLTNPSQLNMACLQRTDRGFFPKTYITLCENEPNDILGTYALDKDDPNLTITYCHGDTHSVIEYLGTRNVYSCVTRNIEEELANNFLLPIEKGIFSNLKGYKSTNT